MVDLSEFVLGVLLYNPIVGSFWGLSIEKFIPRLIISSKNQPGVVWRGVMDHRKRLVNG